MNHKMSDSVEMQENEYPENAIKKEIGKINFLLFSQIGRMRTNSDEIRIIKPLVFCSTLEFKKITGRHFIL